MLRMVRGVCLGALVTMSTTAGAQQKRVLTQDTYDTWRQIQGATLSPDGRWAMYTLTPVVGDGDVVIRATSAPTEFRFPRGWTGRPVTSVTVDSPFVSPPAQFSADSRYAVFLGYRPKAEYDQARRDKVPAAQQPRSSLTIVTLATGESTSVARVRSYRMAREDGRVLAYLMETDDPPRDSSARAGAAEATPRPPARKKDFGSMLVIRDLMDGSEARLADVTSYAVDDSGRYVAYAVGSRSAQGDGLYLRTLANKQTATVMAGEGNYRQLAMDRAGTQIAFLSDRDDFSADKPRFTLYHATMREPRAVAVAAPGALDSLNPSDKGNVTFTRDGSALVFGLAPTPLDTIPADSLADKAVFDLWHWKDRKLQPQQKLDATRDRNRSWTTVYSIRSRKLVRLANDSIPQAQVSDDGRFALLETSLPYAIESMWGEGGSDIYVANIGTGKMSLVASRQEFNPQLSPGAKYVVWFDNNRWHSYATASGARADLTGKLAGVRFADEEWDSPSTAQPYGIGGWTRDDRSVLLYTRHDIWEVDPAGVRAARVVTDSVGARNTLVFRVVDLDREDRVLNPAQPLLLRTVNDETKASGFYRDRLDAVAPPELVMMGDRNYAAPQKARRADQFLLTQQTVSEFPDLYAGASLSTLTRISDANPQQREYLWPSVELVRWTSHDGLPLKGLLYKPEGFDPSKQYPMIVYYYEILSQGLHNYHAPTGRNVINPSVYTSLGYLVFMPDVVYEIGWPGPSASKSILPGVESLIQRGIVNVKAIGLAGQSWGGYQTAYLITQSNLFAAAVPNAPVANMTSAYGGIRWGSGLARSFQYEKTQSRIGGSLWEYPMRYLENSPLFQLDRVNTPVFFMHNDSDDAVPWYQGIELYVGLRRLGKEVYFITYNGDVHNPRKRANQKDVDMRMQQFFANKLQGAPAPDWMVHGIPYLEKGRDQLNRIAPAQESHDR
ncbi:MAG: prolyl oligopeptidase family serine peptidase [Gemmatimonadaceae bacterium]